MGEGLKFLGGPESLEDTMSRGLQCQLRGLLKHIMVCGTYVFKKTP